MQGKGPSMAAVDNCVCTIFKAHDAKYPLRFTEAKMPIRAVIKDSGAFTPEEAESQFLHLKALYKKSLSQNARISYPS